MLLDARWVCPNHCGRTYLNKKSLIRHLRYECGVKRQFQCSMCCQQFKLQGHLKKHQQNCLSRVGGVNLCWDPTNIRELFIYFYFYCVLNIVKYLFSIQPKKEGNIISYCITVQKCVFDYILMKIHFLFEIVTHRTIIYLYWMNNSYTHIKLYIPYWLLSCSYILQSNAVNTSRYK